MKTKKDEFARILTEKMATHEVDSPSMTHSVDEDLRADLHEALHSDALFKLNRKVQGRKFYWGI